MEILDIQNTTCPLTGMFKKTAIEYFLGDVSLGKTYCSEMSMSESRILSAKEIGVEYYDRFILDNGRLDSKTVKMCYDGKMQQQSDFKKFDSNCCKHMMNGDGKMIKNPNYKPCQ